MKSVFCRQALVTLTLWTGWTRWKLWTYGYSIPLGLWVLDGLGTTGYGLSACTRGYFYSQPTGFMR